MDPRHNACYFEPPGRSAYPEFAEGSNPWDEALIRMRHFRNDGVLLFARLECNRWLDELVAPVDNKCFAGDEIAFEQEDHPPGDVGWVSRVL